MVLVNYVYATFQAARFMNYDILGNTRLVPLFSRNGCTNNLIEGVI